MSAGRPDPKLALTAVEVEALRSLRTRLNKPPVSDAASATLGRAFFQVIARSDLLPADPPGPPQKAAELLGAIGTAGMGELNRLLGAMSTTLARPADWRALQVAGAPQAVISRRLQLAGREPDPNARS
jgi:hypothetical protein